MYFYRDSNGNEIDLIIDQGYRQTLCEIKLNKTIQKKHYLQLQKQKSLFSNPDLNVISTYDAAVKLDNDVRNIPVRMINNGLIEQSR